MRARKGSSVLIWRSFPWRPISPENSSWVSASVGRLTLTLESAEPVVVAAAESGQGQAIQSRCVVGQAGALR